MLLKSFLKDVISFFVYIFICLFGISGKVVLVYHSIGEEGIKEDPYRINVSLKDFEKHLKIIARHKERVEVTFDDGYSNIFRNALPLLRKYGINASIFLITDFVDRKMMSEDFAGIGVNIQPLTWGEIKMIDNEGIRFGSHSRHTLDWPIWKTRSSSMS